MYWLVEGLGRTLVFLPAFVSQGICSFVGMLLYRIPSKRRHIVFSNLHHAFPEKTEKWRRQIAKASCRHTIEMGLFSIVSAFFSQKRFLNSLEVPEEVNEQFAEILKEGRSIVILGIHNTLIDSFNAWPEKTEFAFPEMGVMYRPFKHAKIDGLIKRNRERCGARLLSRREGFTEMAKILRKGGVGGILIDQNSGGVGSLIPFFGRVCSATELPGLWVQKFNAIPLMMEMQRVGFWKCRMYMERLPDGMDAKAVTLASNDWLQERLKSSEERCKDWLWTHNRWKVLHRVEERLGMEHKKFITDFAQYPLKKTRIWLLAKSIMKHEARAVEFLKALAVSRPDAEITLCAVDAKVFELKHGGLIHQSRVIPQSKWKACSAMWKLRLEYPDTVLIPEDSPDLRKIGSYLQCPMVLGTSKNAKTRHLKAVHVSDKPLDSWLPFGKQFGLKVGDE